MGGPANGPLQEFASRPAGMTPRWSCRCGAGAQTRPGEELGRERAAPGRGPGTGSLVLVLLPKLGGSRAPV